MKHVFTILIVIVLITIACFDPTDPSTSPQKTGHELASIYCANCHDYPAPNLLDKKSWKKYILPRMGNMLGIYQSELPRSVLIAEDGDAAKKIYPETPLLTTSEWRAIQDFYIKQAPDTLELTDTLLVPVEGLRHFKVIRAPLKFNPPSTTLVQFGQSGKIFLGDAHQQLFLELDQDLNLLNAANIPEGAVHLKEDDQQLSLTVMGSFSPSDQPQGLILQLPKDKKSAPRVPIKNLNRPVHSTYADLNGDGLEEIIVSEFGKWAGRLSLFINQNNERYEQQTIIPQTGAIKSIAYDFNMDKKLDLISLFGQGNEGIFISYHKDDLQFDTKRVVALSPSHGSSYFDLVDFDADGFMDILYCAGDNADFPPIQKPYHGVYVFRNDGKNNFSPYFFYPVNGAYKAITSDFDLDGDLDFAIISFFPDYKNNLTGGFLYLENKDGKYQPATFAHSEMGRWITMDAADYDGDGDEDLILGSLAFEVPDKKTLEAYWAKNGLPFVILENTIRE